jgi:hypothetical protein
VDQEVVSKLNAQVAQLTQECGVANGTANYAVMMHQIPGARDFLTQIQTRLINPSLFQNVATNVAELPRVGSPPPPPTMVSGSIGTLGSTPSAVAPIGHVSPPNVAPQMVVGAPPF